MTATISGNSVTNFTERASRFGDNLLGYFKACWVAYQNNIPCYFTPFENSNSLCIEDLLVSKCPFRKRVTLKKKPVTISQYTNSLFCVSFRSKHINWSISAQDPVFIAFRRKLQQTVRPCYTISSPSIPDGIISVAVHVRRGGGFDAPLLTRGKVYADKQWPLKFPPLDFYIQQIRTLYQLLHEQSLYIHIFTDDPHPKQIAQQFECALTDCKVSFRYRTSKNHHAKNIIDDLFSMTLFDCLIRPNSNFSICAQLLGNHQIIISPIASTWENERLVITKTRIHVPSIIVSPGNKRICDISGLKNKAASETLEFV